MRASMLSSVWGLLSSAWGESRYVWWRGGQVWGWESVEVEG